MGRIRLVTAVLLVIAGRVGATDLAAENAALKGKIAELQAKIASLEKQLMEERGKSAPQAWDDPFSLCPPAPQMPRGSQQRWSDGNRYFVVPPTRDDFEGALSIVPSPRQPNPNEAVMWTGRVQFIQGQGQFIKSLPPGRLVLSSQPASTRPSQDKGGGR